MSVTDCMTKEPKIFTLWFFWIKFANLRPVYITDQIVLRKGVIGKKKKKRTVCIYFTILFLQGKRLGSFIKILRLRNEWENFLVSYHFV